MWRIPAVTGMAIPGMQTGQSCQPGCAGPVFQENRGAGDEIRAFLSEDMSNRLMEKMFLMPALAFGSGPCLGDLVQEFGWITWPPCSEFFFHPTRQ